MKFYKIIILFSLIFHSLVGLSQISQNNLIILRDKIANKCFTRIHHSSSDTNFDNWADYTIMCFKPVDAIGFQQDSSIALYTSLYRCEKDMITGKDNLMYNSCSPIFMITQGIAENKFLMQYLSESNQDIMMFEITGDTFEIKTTIQQQQNSFKEIWKLNTEFQNLKK